MEKIGRDELILILENLDDRSLLNLCSTNTQIKKICDYEFFWKNRIEFRFGLKSLKLKATDRSWKNFYLNIIRLLSLADNDKNDAMFLALEEGKTDLVEFFIENGADQLDVALNIAARLGNKEMVKLLVDKGEDDWDLGLYGAAFGGHLDLVKFFITKGALLLGRALEFAEQGGRTNIVKYLKEKINKQDYWRY